jgi:hypothetical protein
MLQLRSETHAYALMAQTDTLYRGSLIKLPDYVIGYTGVLRRTRSGRNYYLIRTYFSDLIHTYTVIEKNFACFSQGLDLLDQIIGKRIIIIDYQNH